MTNCLDLALHNVELASAISIAHTPSRTTSVMSDAARCACGRPGAAIPRPSIAPSVFTRISRVDVSARVRVEQRQDYCDG